MANDKTDPNEAALQAGGLIPSAADTHAVVLSDTTVCKDPGSNDATTYHYDAAGRMDWEKHQAFNDYTGVSGGTQHSVTPETDYTYDGLNNLLRTVQRDDSTLASPVDHITNYTYGAGGRLATVTDAEGFTHTYQYDKAGRVTRDEYTRQLPSGTSHEAQATDYDLEGRVMSL